MPPGTECDRDTTTSADWRWVMSQDAKSSRKGLSRRNLLKSGAASVAAALGATRVQVGSAAGIAAIGSEPDLVLVNGKIYTMDAQNRIAASITIRAGRII